MGVPCAANQAISASGSLATFASFRILPCASTMHTLALSNDTSYRRALEVTRAGFPV
jgi:hypothetical protein